MIFHNAIRLHEGLNGQTPIEAWRIKVKDENKWITLIQNASKKIRVASLILHS
jgi:hypothetical protein